ncbi:MAG: UV DNA damage repair endonuclease UvsE [Caldilineaceae bacterium]
MSLAYVRDILAYLHRQEIRFYRLAGQLAPYLTHPDLPQFHGQVEESLNELAAIGDMARQLGIRLTMHPGHYIQLSSPDPARVARSQHELTMCTAILDAMGLGTEAVIVIHIGGRYEEKHESRARFVHNVAALPGPVRQRVALENDDRLYDIADLLWVHHRTGIRLVLDILHHRCHNTTGASMLDALHSALATWPIDQQPKVHLSSSRTELRYLQRQGQRHITMPLANQHSDFINPFELIELLQLAQQHGLRPFDIMLEAKAKDLALLRLREQVARYAPELALLIE